MSERELDARGLNCPLPVLKARKALKSMPAGDRLRVLATDPKAPDDVRALCDVMGDLLLEEREEAGVITMLIERRARNS